LFCRWLGFIVGWVMSDALQQLVRSGPETGIVLGSGLGAVAESFESELVVPYAEVVGMPVSKVPGHAGRFVLGRVPGTDRRVVIAQGRSHLYEGLSASEITAGVRFMAEELGIRRLFLTNAAGAIDPSFEVGGLMMLTDHLNLLGVSPLTGGPHFHDMSTVYSLRLREALFEAADRLGMRLHHGVYAAVPGPQYETPAEVRMLRTLGAQAVGMSTVPEAIQARALGLEVAGLSMLTNWGAGLAPATLDHAEVVQVGEEASLGLGQLLHAVLDGLSA
jgi:purine-nucleoside phosphorylase